MRMRLILSVAILLLAACGRPTAPATYPETTHINFMHACQTHATAAMCSCIWERVSAEVPVADFNALEQLSDPAREANPLMQQINGYAMACQALTTPAPTAPATEPSPAP